MTFHHFPTLFKIGSYLHMGAKSFQIAWRLKTLLTSLPFFLQNMWLFLQGVTPPPPHPLSPYGMIRGGRRPPLLIWLSDNFSRDKQKKMKHRREIKQNTRMKALELKQKKKKKTRAQRRYQVRYPAIRWDEEATEEQQESTFGWTFLSSFHLSVLKLRPWTFLLMFQLIAQLFAPQMNCYFHFHGSHRDT